MILISHRGNINGPNPDRENHPDYIMGALYQGYNVEIDVWYVNGKLMLGHDGPQYFYDFSSSTIKSFYDKLWLHCKNVDALLQLKDSPLNQLNYFWHEEDTLTLTSKNYIWAYPGKQPIKGSIAVMPEIYNDNLSNCIGVCSDYIENYTK
jgi:hypothetical protein